MAWPTFEVLFQPAGRPVRSVEVDIVPGASAINTCAFAMVGAPLTHDFCAISLSDLLTPLADHRPPPRRGGLCRFPGRPVQPQERRTRQIEEAQRIFLRHRA